MYTRCPTRLGWALAGLPWNSWQPSPPLPTLIGPFVLNNYRLRILDAPKVAITIILLIVPEGFPTSWQQLRPVLIKDGLLKNP